MKTTMRSCYLAAIRNPVRGSGLVRANARADPDAVKVAANVVTGVLAYFTNHPAVQVGDSQVGPNLVTGRGLAQGAPPLSISG